MIVIFMNMTSNCQGTRPTQQPIAHQISMKFLRFESTSAYQKKRVPSLHLSWHNYHSTSTNTISQIEIEKFAKLSN